MQRLTALPLLLACVAALAAPVAPVNVEATLKKPGDVHEACAHLAKGEKRTYHWKATTPVDFNIHYHDGADVSYAVKRDGMRGDGGTFVAKVEQGYCWMWTARIAPATITGQILE